MNHGADTTVPSTLRADVFGMSRAVPVLTVAYAPVDAVTTDRVAVTLPFTVGRADECTLSVNDGKMSKAHFRIDRDDVGYWVADLGSTNGTFVQGEPVSVPVPLSNQTVIRAGSALFVFNPNGAPLLRPPPAERFGLAGRFHVAPLIQQLRETASSARHILLTGPSGSGKELVARALSQLMGERGAPLAFLAHNAARFSSEEEATATLFGVASRVFSNVSARSGLIEEAGEGIFFLDEVHNLPERVQRSLLRVMEEGKISRIGETLARNTAVRFVLASNDASPGHGLAHDLLARLRIVAVPPLEERIADIPAVFLHLLQHAATSRGLSSDLLRPQMGPDHFEAMCLDGFRETNVRGLLDLTDRLVSRLVTGVAPDRAVASMFSERFSSSPVAARRGNTLPNKTSSAASGADAVPPRALDDHSHYEQHKELIIAVYRESKGNLSAVERTLQSQGIRCSRRWLRNFTKKWGIRR